jgi:hypothetical protein
VTTTVRVQTHSWPVKAVITDKYAADKNRGFKTSVSDEDVPPNSVRDFHLTDSRSITFHEVARPDETVG